MITEELLLSLVRKPEDERLDFKSEEYKLNNDYAKADLIKDIICMANTPRDTAAYIVLGVVKFPNGTYTLKGVGEVYDDEQIISQLTDRVYPMPAIHYHVVPYEEKMFGIIEILPEKSGPYLPKKDFPAKGNVLRQNQIYFRRGSKNDIPGHQEYKKILAWFNQGEERIDLIENIDPSWERFLDAVHNFDITRRYILLINQIGSENESVSALGKAPWSMVFDLDFNSDIDGAFKKIRPVIEQKRSLYMITKGDRPIFYPERATYWFFTRGLTGRNETLINTDSWRNWIGTYGEEIREQLRGLGKAILPAQTTCIAAGFDTQTSPFLRSLLEAHLSVLGEAVDFVILSNDPSDLHSVASEFDATLLDIPIHHVYSALNSVLESEKKTGEERSIPSSSGAPLEIANIDWQWFREELEILTLNEGLSPVYGRTVGKDFLRGKDITWYELSLHYDVDRDKTEKLSRQVQNELTNKRTVRINLYHEPGAGGSTVGKRLLWDFHRTYPCAILTRCNPIETSERLFRLTSFTGQPMLLLVDGAFVSEGVIDELFILLRSRQVPVILLQIRRRFKLQSEKERAFYLESELTTAEATRFKEVFSREVPAKRKNLEALLISKSRKVRTAFYFGLETFGRDFLGLGNYVKHRMDGLTDIQKQILGFLSLAHYYAQKQMKAQAFSELLGTPKKETVNLEKALTEGALELIVNVQPGVWRTAHNIIAREILEQYLTPIGADRQNWAQNLSEFSKKFAKFCLGNAPVISDEMNEILKRTFIYRDSTDILGKEKSEMQTFSEIVEEIPAREGKLSLLQTLVDLFPDDAHFWAHLGRFYAIEMRDYENALDCIEHAIAIQEEDHVLHHMRGMILRYQINRLIEEKSELDQIVPLSQKASDAFSSARRLNPDDEHGYISEAQMLVKVLDYASRLHSGKVTEYLESPNSHPYLREGLEHAEDLLEQVRRNREGEGASPYEEETRGKISSLYGRDKQALQVYDRLLERSDIYKPPIRRQIIWTYLAKHGRAWDKLTDDEINRALRLLENNLDEESKNEKNLRLWIQAIRYAQNKPGLETIVERISYWRANFGSLDAVYYLYVCYALLAIEGSPIARDDAKRFLDECRQMARFRQNRTRSLEWLGFGNGIEQLVHQSLLGGWNINEQFWEKTSQLRRIKGRIAKMEAPQEGQIELENGLYVFFVPARGGGFSRSRLNKLVDFYLGFSYDGLRAWEVRNLEE